MIFSFDLIELTDNWGQAEPYALGSAFGHLAIGVPDVYKTCERLAAPVSRYRARPARWRMAARVIAFIEDPDGYRIELVERP